MARLPRVSTLGAEGLRDAVTRNGGTRRWARIMGVRHVTHRPGYAPVWTEERIRSDLRRYLSRRTQWPSREQFERDGQTALRNAVNRTGGPDRWAREFGLPRPDRRAGIRRSWTPEAIETELAGLIGSGTTWPSKAEFRQAGLASMLSAIYSHEGPAYWAKRMNVTRAPSPAAGATRRWTEERIRSELGEFCAGRTFWPTEREFAEAGKRALYSAASRNGGVASWAQQLGLERGRRKGC